MCRRDTHSRRTARGFTLVEAIATIVIIGTVGVLASRLIYTAMSVYDSANTRSELSEQLSAAMDRVVTELRTIQIKASTTPVQPDITSMTASSITFNAATSSRTIALSGSNIVLSGAAATSTVLASNVSAFTLTGLDASNSAVPASPSAAQIQTIRRFSITLTATKNGQTETLRSRVFIRALASGSGAP